MSDSKQREALKRLGAEVAPDQTKPRLVSFNETKDRTMTIMSVIFPAQPRRWWGGGGSPPRGHMYIGGGARWYTVRFVDGGNVQWDRYADQVDDATSAILADLWVRREKIVERKQ